MTPSMRGSTGASSTAVRDGPVFERFDPQTPRILRNHDRHSVASGM